MSNKLAEKLKAYNNYANECIFFKYVYDESDIVNEESKNGTSDIADQKTFKPEFTHQIFGDDEAIFGYKSLRINYYLTPGLLDACICLKYKEKISPQRFEGIEADDVYGEITKFGCSPGFTTNLDTFCSQKLKQDMSFIPFGEKIYEYTDESRPVLAKKANITNGSPKETKSYEIYKVDSNCVDFSSQKFVDYLNRVQTILVFYIETSSFIDTDDTQWSHYFLYEKLKRISSSESSCQFRYTTIGYCSVYNYYAYPDKQRARISQILVFPLHQRAGHGAELLESIYRDSCQNPKVLDVTAESPSNEFVQMRDYVTTRMCSKLSSFADAIKLKNGFSKAMMDEAMRVHKMPKLQSRRCYEILRMAHTNANKEQEWRDFRLDVKKRLNTPFIRRRSKFARNAGIARDEKEQPEHEPSCSKTTEKRNMHVLDGRFGSSSSTNGFDSSHGHNIEAITIGFQSASHTNGFSSKSAVTNGSVKLGKTVTFKNASLNSSTSTNDADDSGEQDEVEHDLNDVNLNDKADLFISEEDRKKYLEEQFQQTVTDYRRVIARLEHTA
jgi:histone acetyltransferase 1